MRKMTLSQIRTVGLAALTQSLGPVGMARFLQQYETGTGDYTKERTRKIAMKSIDEILLERQRRQNPD